MGKTLLPVDAFKDLIVRTVLSSPVTIAVSDPGAGKTTGIPQYFYHRGLSMLVTQPRRIAARTASRRVASELRVRHGREVGYHIARDAFCTPHTQLLYTTDGVALISTLMNAKFQRNILMIDEFHTWNARIEMLVAWSYAELKRRNDFRLLLTSASCDARRLSDYFDGAPIIEIPGKMFPIENRPPGDSNAADVVSMVREKRKTLVFLPGRREIARESAAAAAALAAAGLSARILPLHGGLTAEEQQLCFEEAEETIVIMGTNVAEESLTIPGVRAVIDSGLERQVALEHGVEMSLIRPISKASSTQRRGRCGRVADGVFIDRGNPAERADYSTPEIYRTRLDGIVLRLAARGVEIENVRFFNQPSAAALYEAKHALRLFGCFDENDDITDVGYAVDALPASLSVPSAKMLLEAKKLGVVGDIIKIIAILQADGVVDPRSGAWRRFCVGETQSDLLAQLSVFDAAEAMRWNGASDDELEQAGISLSRFDGAISAIDYLRKELAAENFDVTSSGDRDAILRAICAGMLEHACIVRGGKVDHDGVQRDFSYRNSVVKMADDDCVVGIPADLEVTWGANWAETRETRRFFHLRHVTRIRPEWLRELAPDFVIETPAHCAIYSESDEMHMLPVTVRFNGREVATRMEPVADEDDRFAESKSKKKTPYRRSSGWKPGWEVEGTDWRN